MVMCCFLPPTSYLRSLQVVFEESVFAPEAFWSPGDLPVRGRPLTVRRNRRVCVLIGA